MGDDRSKDGENGYGISHAAWTADPQFFVASRQATVGHPPGNKIVHLFRRLFLEALERAYVQGHLCFFGELAALRDPQGVARYLARLREIDWVVYAKPPFGGPQQVLEYLGRYTHRVAISNQRLLEMQAGQVSFRWKDYRHPQRPKLTGRNLGLCPKCGAGTMIRIEILFPCHGPVPLRMDALRVRACPTLSLGQACAPPLAHQVYAIATLQGATTTAPPTVVPAK